MILWSLGGAKLLVILQTPGAAVTGTITSAGNGVPIAGAEVMLPDLGRVTVSDDSGRYAFRAVVPGPQHLNVRRLGFAPRVLHALVPRLGEVDIDIALEPSPVRLHAVDVHPSVEIRGLDGTPPASGFDRSLSMAAVRNDPLLSEPDAFVAAGGGHVVLSPEAPGGLHVRGGASDQTSFLLDGVPILSPYHAAGVFSAWNPDALDRLTVSPPSPDTPQADALSGVVAATTRTPSERLNSQGSISTTQIRTTLDGPLGLAHAGVLASVRLGFPGFIAPQRERSYLAGSSSDALLTLELPAFDGTIRALGYSSSNALRASATAGDSVPVVGRRNQFAWTSRSLGARWARPIGSMWLTLRGWRAVSDAHATWILETGGDMAGTRQDNGFGIRVDRTAVTKSGIGLELRRSETRYETRSEDGSNRYVLRSRTPLVTLFGSHERPITGRLRAAVAVSGVTAAGHLYGRSYSELRWTVSSPLTVSGGYIHARQFAQTLRNAESIVDAIFPVDLYAGTGSSGVPVARSDDGILAVGYRPTDGVQVGAQLYTRAMSGLALVAPRTDGAFSERGFRAGSGDARGLSVDASASGARYGFVASYGWQHGRLRYGDTSFVPTYVTAHLVQAGVIVYPSATFSARLGVTGAAGRRATALSGSFEWEACNALDRGCEFAGTPRSVGALGGVMLPAYGRVDLGVRKHWHIDIHGRDALVAVFGTVTNVLGRPNVLTVIEDPTTGQPTPIGMRPLAPLVVGADWRF